MVAKTFDESEWLDCGDPAPMLEYLLNNDILTDRKQRLLDCACVRRIWHLIHDIRGRRAVEIAERYVDGFARVDEIREAQAVALAVANAQSGIGPHGRANTYRVLKAAAEVAWEFRSGADPLRHAAEACAWKGSTGYRAPQRRRGRTVLAAERKTQAALLRDIFGSPFHPVTSARSWRTLEVVRLAQTIYDDRAFARMPELGGALERADCRDRPMLAHCRQPGQHVRGCWVVDLVLGLN
ncbi:MAG TPA: hypothetical protein VGY55_07730 [Pirellulales bacterium]|nr:hypothetical protein [Pirellulales bacterium]